MKINKIICIATIVLLLLAAGCGSTDGSAAGDVTLETVSPERAHILTDASWFSDFSVQGNTVYLKCMLVIECVETTVVRIYGSFPKDAGRLLTESLLPGGFGDDTAHLRDTSTLLPGQNELTVFFVGTFAGSAQKQDRLLPVLYLVESQPGAYWEPSLSSGS